MCVVLMSIVDLLVVFLLIQASVWGSPLLTAYENVMRIYTSSLLVCARVHTFVFACVLCEFVFLLTYPGYATDTKGP